VQNKSDFVLYHSSGSF